MLSPADGPLAEDNKTGLNGAISHWRGFVKLNQLLRQRWKKRGFLWQNMKKQHSGC